MEDTVGLERALDRCTLAVGNADIVGVGAGVFGIVGDSEIEMEWDAGPVSDDVGELLVEGDTVRGLDGVMEILRETDGVTVDDAVGSAVADAVGVADVEWLMDAVELTESEAEIVEVPVAVAVGDCVTVSLRLGPGEGLVPTLIGTFTWAVPPLPCSPL